MNKLTYRFASLLCAIFLITVLAACGNSEDAKNGSERSSAWDKIKQKGTIVVGTSGTLFPSSYHEEKENKLTGYDVEIVREAAKRLGLKVEFKEMGFDGMLPSLQSGKIDIAANDITITGERKKVFGFSVPYKYSYGTMIVRKDGHSGIESLKDLKGKKAGGAATSIYSDIVRKYGGEVRTYGNATNDIYLRDVDLGRTDAILNDYYLQTLALKALPEFDLVLHPDIKYMPNNQAFAMEKGEDELQTKINETLKEMKQDGTLTKISKKFFAGKNASKKPEGDIKEIELN